MQIPEEVKQTIRDEVIPVFRKELKGREIMPTNPVDPATRQYGYDKEVDDEMEEPAIIVPGGDIPADGPKARERILAAIYKIAKQYKVPREDFMAGEYINRSLNRIVREVAEVENDLIFNGATALGIYGLTDVPATSVAADDNWDDHSETGATPYNDIIELAQEMYDESGGRFGQLEEMTFVVNDYTAKSLRLWYQAEVEKGGDRAIDLMNMDLDNIITTGHIDKDKAYLLHTGSDIAELIVAEEIQTEEFDYNKDNQTYFTNIFERVLPIFYQYGDTAGQTQAVGELTNLD